MKMIIFTIKNFTKKMFYFESVKIKNFLKIVLIILNIKIHIFISENIYNTRKCLFYNLKKISSKKNFFGI